MGRLRSLVVRGVVALFGCGTEAAAVGAPQNL